MRKILTLIFGALIALPALAQTDSVYLFSTGQGVLGDSIFLPTEFFRRGASVPKLLTFGLRKAKTHSINMGMDAVYIPESDVPGANVTRSLTKIITYQVPVSVQVTQAQLDSISKYIKKITEPVVVPKPDIITNLDNVLAVTQNKYSANWLHYAGNSWNANHLGNSLSVTYTAGSILEITFDGYKCDWYTEPRFNHGVAALSIDGGAETIIDLYDRREDNISAKVWSSPVLASGVHVLKIRMTGNKNPAWSTDFPVGHPKRAEAQGNNIIHDYLKVFKKAP